MIQSQMLLKNLGRQYLPDYLDRLLGLVVDNFKKLGGSGAAFHETVL